jgi:ribosomal protein S18 acetylase RimI-like enzyme
MNDPELAWRAEEACLNAWPSPRQVLFNHWLLRFSGGPIRRTNSVNPLRASAYETSTMIGIAQRLYHARQQPAMFRVPSIALGIEASLERRGFIAEGETSTLFADLGASHFAPDGEVDLALDPSLTWLAAKRRLTPVSDVGHQIYRAMIDAIALPRVFAALANEGRIASVAYGVIHSQLLVVESVATDPELRQHGFGRRTVGSLMGWGKAEGAKGACLQVGADNVAAQALYRKLGFCTELYRYHYRREPSR